MSRPFQLAAACGIAAPVAFVVSTVLAGVLREGYDPTTQAISELFEVGAPTSTIVVVGFVAFGLLALPFAWALYHAGSPRRGPRRRRWRSSRSPAPSDAPGPQRAPATSCTR